MSKVKLPGLTTALYTNDDAFQAIADRINQRVREVVSEELRDLLTTSQLPSDASGAGPTIVAAIAAIIHSAGYLTGSFEPHIKGDVVAGIVQAQFNDGRRDFLLYHRTGGTA